MYDPDEYTPTTYAAKLIQEGCSPEKVREIMQQEKIIFPSISDVLNDFLGKKNLSVDIAAELSGINPATFYRIMNRQRNPSRNALIRIAMALALNMDETQVLLKSGNCAALSAARERDIIIIDAIINEKYIDEVNESLIAANLPDLNGKG